MLSHYSKNHKKPSSLVFYVFYIPFLIVALLIAGVGLLSNKGYFQNKNVVNGNVLSSGSDGDKEGDDDKDSDSDKEDDSKDDDSHESDDNDKNEDSHDDKPTTTTSIKPAVRTLKQRTFVVNPDGTKTETESENKNGEVKVEIKTYDINGRKLKVEKYESKDAKEKSRVKVYDEFGKQLGDFRFETTSGKKIEIRSKNGEVELSRVMLDLDKNELVLKNENELEHENDVENENEDDSKTEVENESENKTEVEHANDDTTKPLETKKDFSEPTLLTKAARMRIRVSGDNFVISKNGTDAVSKFPITIDDTTGAVYVKTPKGDVQLKTTPEAIIKKIQQEKQLETVETVELSSSNDTKVGSELEYKVEGVSNQKLLGIFKVTIPSTVVYDAKTGKFLIKNLTFGDKILDFFSF